MTQVFIIGLGLIGGSIALCIKKSNPNIKIIGYDIQQEELMLATKLGVIDESAVQLEEGALQADFIFISTPVDESERIMLELAKLPLKDNVIISDTGSTKAKIMNSATCFNEKNITFIGGHPMAGSHKSGVFAAKSILFENAFYILTPAEDTREEQLTRLKDILKGTKAKFIVVTPEEHDYLTGVVSHFPHLVAASIVHQAKKSSHSQSLIPRLAAGGFRDITRIASSSPKMWRDILLHNKEVMVDLLDEWKLEMEYVRNIIKTEDGEAIFSYFNNAKEFRDLLPAKDKGVIPSFYDLFVDVPDYPGVISEITGYLAEEKISITNIRIIESREDVYGILVISFQTENDRLLGLNCILKHTAYEVSVAP